MKKLLALVLALIMVLGLGVTAFAVENIHVITLTKETTTEDDPEVIVALGEDDERFVDNDINKKVYLVGPEGDDYYVEIADYANLKNVTVSATGNVTAEIVKFDADTMRYPNAVYAIYDNEQVDFGFTPAEKIIFSNGTTTNLFAFKDQTVINNLLTVFGSYDLTKLKTQANFKFADGTTFDEYSYLDYVAEKLNDIKTVKKDRFSVVCLKNTTPTAATPTYVKLDKNLLKITVADNYSAAYKEGTVKITAKKDKKDVVANLTIISDVNIFEYEEVKWAGDNAALVINDPGYSDYLTAKLGYNLGANKASYVPDDLRVAGSKATVVSTTAFRAIEGEELQVASEAGDTPAILVTIDEVAKGQKGVNFAVDSYKGSNFIFYDEDDEKLTAGKEKGKVEYFKFGFLGDQVIASDFEIEVKLGKDPYQLRELFGKKVEEEDIITYYVLKDGVKIDDFTIDYKDDDMDEDVELTILGKAGDKLGYYTVTLDAPAAEEEGEENPNTGAESVVGVVAAMAVISLATAAAVSLKK